MFRRICTPRSFSKSAIALSVLLALGACSSSDDDDGTESVQMADSSGAGVGVGAGESVMVQLDASQEIPTPTGVPADATGTAEVSVGAGGVVTATLTVSGLSGPALMAHIHEGAAGETGGVLIGLESADGGTTWTVAEDAPALTAEQVEAFNNGGLYFNVHTEANMAGEIRGQIIAGNAPDQAAPAAVMVQLEAGQEIPTPTGVPAEATGTAEVSVDADGVVTATLTVSGLSGPALMAHIHEGVAGETGGVLIGLESADGGTTWTVAADAPALTEEQIDAFNNGGLYFNVHTEANMAGEIRGQINAENAAEQNGVVMVQLDASQEVPAPVGVPAEATGSATVSVNEQGVISATVTVSGLSGPATVAHIHQAVRGEFGGVIAALESADGGTTWTVVPDDSALNEDEVAEYNRGEFYINVHTEANAPGEIRGQIEPNAIAASSTSQRLLSSVARSDGAETLLDTRTGLVWVNDIQFCMEGVTRAVDAQCGALSDMAVSGITDWRLPTSDEMAEITRAVDADESVTLKYINSNCSVMTTSDGWVLNENSVAPGARSQIEPSDAGVRCVSGEIQ